jgi:hypothetical protein
MSYLSIVFTSTIFLIAIAVGNYASADSRESDKTVSIVFSSESYSESFSLLDLYEDDPSFVKKGRSLYSHTELNMEYRFSFDQLKAHSYLIGYFKRYDYQARHSNGAAELYYVSQHEFEGEALALDLELKFDTLSSQGLRLGYQWNFNRNARWLVYLDIGQSEQLMSANVDGYLEQDPTDSASGNSLAGDIYLDYYFQQDPIYSRSVNPAKGQVFAVSSQLDFNTDISRHHILLKDLYFLARWPNAPYTQNEINSQRVQTRDDGSFNIRPLGSGRESFSSLDQTLAMRIYSQHELNNSWGEYDFVMDVNRIYLTNQVNLGLQKRVSKQQYWQLKYSILDPAVEATWQGSNIGFKLRVDHYNVSSIQQMTLSMGYYF